MPAASTTSRKPNETVPDFAPLFSALVENVRLIPSLGQALADQLGVSVKSVTDLPVGFWPAHSSFVTAERDHTGKIIGLVERYFDSGKKLAVKGSKRGLIYRPDDFPAKPTPAADAAFVRVGDAGVPCPVCGRENDGCLVSDENPEDPAAVICVRVSEGSTKKLATGYLHRRHNKQSIAGFDTLDPASPVLVTEGASDVLAGMDLGYRTIGRPSAGDGIKFLVKMVPGQDVILVGDNDPAGRDGAEAAFQALRPICRSLIKCFPPQGVKDLRAWHPTLTEFQTHLAATSVKPDNSDLLEIADPRSLAIHWYKHTQTKDDKGCMQYVYEHFYYWDGTRYRPLALEQLSEKISAYFNGRMTRTVRPDGSVKVYKLQANRSFNEEILFSLRGFCFVDVEPHTHEPFLIATGKSMDLTRAVVFRNGLLDITTDTLTPLSPDVFLTSTLPYEYRPGYRCERFLHAVNEYFVDDQESIDLLQEWSGYFLIPDNRFEAILMMIGYPGAGKGTVLTALEAMLGPERFTAMRFTDLRDTHGTAKLFGKYLAVFSEEDTNELSRSDASRVLAALKGLSGNDCAVINEKFRRAFSTRLFCRAIYSSNECPVFSDASRSLSRRLHILRFSRIFDTPDTLLKMEIEREAPGIALWAIEGLKRLLAKGRFTRPIASEVFSQAILGEANPLGSEFDDFLRVAPDAMVEKQLLYGLHTTIARVENIPILPLNKFFSKFWSRYPRTAEGWGTDGKKKFRVIRGVTITTDGLAYVQQHCV